METAYIFDALRTARGKGMPHRDEKPGGPLCETPPEELISQLSNALLSRNNIDKENIQRLILGCVGQVGAQGGHIALVSRIHAGLPDHVAVKTLNNYCVSGLTAISDSVMAAQSGGSGLSLAGGVECISQVPFLADKARYYTDPAVIKATRWAPPVMGAELVASIENYSQAELDAVSVESHQRAHAAWEAGHYNKSVLAIRSEDGETLLYRDELIRGDLSLEKLATMKPAFEQQGEAGFDDMMLAAYPDVKEINHVHTIAHCPGMADGAALAITGNKTAGEQAGLTPRARVIAYAECASDPVIQFDGGFNAMQSCLDQAGMSLEKIDLIEFMEAFAAVPLKFYRNYNVDRDKVNVNGGHLAMGHPMGATGAILLTHLLHELERRDQTVGLVVAHAGGGIGSAMIIERV